MRPIPQKTALVKAIFSTSDDKEEQLKLRNEQMHAESGDVSAQIAMGLRFKNGTSIAKDFSKAIPWFKRAANKSLQAKYNLAVCHMERSNEKYNEEDDKTAFELFEELSNSKNSTSDPEIRKIIAAAKAKLGMCYEKGIKVRRDKTIALRLYEEAETLGDPDATYYKAVCHYRFAEPDHDQKAYAIFEKLAAANHAGAQYFQGLCYKKGVHVRKDDVKAFEWFSKSGLANDTDAQYETAVCYEEARGVARDEKIALMWFQAAASREHWRAHNSIGGFYEYGRAGLEKDPVKAAGSYRISAGGGDSLGQYNYARCLQKGAGVALDPVKAKQEYLKSARQGNNDARYALYLLYKSQGKKELMFKWCRKAANAGLIEAQFNMAEHCLMGDGCRQSPGDAVSWLKDVAKSGDDYLALRAQCTLARWFGAGHKGVRKDEKESLEWLDATIRSGQEQYDDNYDVSPSPPLAEARYELACRLAAGKGIALNVKAAIEHYRQFADANSIAQQEIIASHYSCADRRHHALFEKAANPHVDNKEHEQSTPSDLLRQGKLFFLGLEKTKRNNTVALDFLKKFLVRVNPLDKPILGEVHFYIAYICSKGDERALRDEKQALDHFEKSSEYAFIAEFSIGNQKPQIYCAAHHYADLVFYGTGCSRNPSKAKTHYQAALQQYQKFTTQQEVKKICDRVRSKILECDGISPPQAVASTIATTVVVASAPPPAPPKDIKSSRYKKIAAAAASTHAKTPDLKEDCPAVAASEPNPFSVEYVGHRKEVVARDMHEMVDSGGFMAQPHQVRLQNKELDAAIEEAWVSFRLGDAVQALKKFEALHRDKRVLIGLARCNEKLGRIAKAEMYYADLLKRFPKDPEIIASHAYFLSQLGESHQQCLRLERALKEYPQDEKIIVAYIYCLMHKNSFAQALIQIEIFGKQHPKCHKVKECYLRYFQMTGQYQKALMMVKELLAWNPENPRILYMKAQIHVHINNDSMMAVRMCHDIRKRFPEYKPAIHNLIHHYENIGEYKNALCVLEGIDIGDEVAREQKTRGAQDQFNVLKKRYAGQEAELLICARLYSKMGAHKKAKQFYEQVLEINPGNVMAAIGLRNQSIMLEKLEKPLLADSKSAANTLLRHVDVLAYAKYLYASNKQKAEEVHEKAVQRFPHLPKAHADRIRYCMADNMPKASALCVLFLETFCYERSAYLLGAEIFLKQKDEVRLAGLCQQYQKYLSQDTRLLYELNLLFIKADRKPFVIADPAEEKNAPKQNSAVVTTATMAPMNSAAEGNPPKPSSSLVDEKALQPSSDKSPMTVAPNLHYRDEGYAAFVEAIEKHGLNAFSELTRLAHGSDAFAQRTLGNLYGGVMEVAGIQVENDFKVAVQWYRRAAERNDPYAQLNMGLACIDGRGVDEDPIQAVKWYTKAAGHGIALALYYCGLAYANGEGGVAANANTALGYFTRAIAADKPSTEITQNALKEIEELKTANQFNNHSCVDDKYSNPNATLIAATNAGLGIVKPVGSQATTTTAVLPAIENPLLSQYS
jgi:TPR repeat protein/Tfp pilus assembly protein PilF